MSGTDPAIAAVGFDYAILDPHLADQARSTAVRIRDRLNSCMFDIGRDLISIKKQMEHGAFGAWLKAEFNYSAHTAQNYMNAAVLFDRKTETVSLLSPSLVYALAAPSAPAAVVNEVLAPAETGNIMSAVTIKAKSATAIEADRHAAREAKKTPEQIVKERVGRRSKIKREERRSAEWQAEEAKNAREERERSERLTPLLKRVVAVISRQDHVALNDALASRHWRERDTIIRLLGEMTGPHNDRNPVSLRPRLPAPPATRSSRARLSRCLSCVFISQRLFDEGRQGREHRPVLCELRRPGGDH